MSARKKREPSKYIEITRVYDAPVRAVWNAWTDPKEAAKWWGPRGFTITTLSKDLRPGGHWTYIMHGPDGVDYPNKAIYYEVEECAKLVYDHGGNDDNPPLFHVTVLFSEFQSKTTMQIKFTLSSPEAAVQIQKHIQQAGGNTTWDRLDEYLGQTTAEEERFVINRSFEVPIAQMFDLWTDPTHMAHWVPPTGSRMEFLKADIRPGGSTFYLMTNDHFKMYGRAHYLEISPPNRIVYTQEFCDEKGGMARHPMAPTWPETMLTVVQLYEEGPDQTRVQITWRAHGKVSDVELATFVAARAGMTQGWTGSFDKLDAYLESLNPETP
jgi:uncharacterized protein YndB with AHSA1/START domain